MFNASLILTPTYWIELKTRGYPLDIQQFSILFHLYLFRLEENVTHLVKRSLFLPTIISNQA